MCKKWLKQRLNKSMFKWIGSSKDDKVWPDYEKYFLESYLSYSLVNTNVLLTKLIENKILWYFLIWGTPLELQLGMPGRSFETSITQYRDTHTHAQKLFTSITIWRMISSTHMRVHMRVQCSSHTRTYTHNT